MSIGDWTSWNERQTRKREEIAPELLEELPEPEPMEVQESDPSQTWIGRIFRWPKGTP